MDIKIFVEGIADAKFLKDYVFHKFNRSLGENEIIETKGWASISAGDNAGEMLRNKLMLNSDEGGVNLIIFDADSDLSMRREDILGWKDRFGVEFELFLWPNNVDSGDLETVLENVINSNNRPIFECWDRYEGCLAKVEIEGREEALTLPARKTKIYGYLEALLGESNSQKDKIKEKKRNYRKKDHWDLDAVFLNPLDEFLSLYFTNS